MLANTQMLSDMSWVHSDPSTIPSTTELVVLTTISRSLMRQQMYENFLLSLQRFGYPCVLALPVNPLQPAEREPQFWLRRTAALMHALHSLPRRSVVTITDSTDVIWTEGPAALMIRFKTIGHRACFAAEMLCDTPWCRVNDTAQSFMNSVAPGNADAKYLNAGSAMGDAEALGFLFVRMHRCVGHWWHGFASRSNCC